MNVYPRVRVAGAPGYADFEGELILEVPSADGSMKCVVGVMWLDNKEILVVDSFYVEVID